MVDYRILISDLNWNLPKEVQEEAIKKLIHIEDGNIFLLIQPINKEYWENAAKVLKYIGYPRIKSVIPNLLGWLQDMNWPGAFIIMDILENTDKESLIPYVKEALVQASKENDLMWITAIKELVSRCNITEIDFNQKEIYSILNLAEW